MSAAARAYTGFTPGLDPKKIQIDSMISWAPQNLSQVNEGYQKQQEMTTDKQDLTEF
jgi:hypothetical protein